MRRVLSIKKPEIKNLWEDGWNKEGKTSIVLSGAYNDRLEEMIEITFQPIVTGVTAVIKNSVGEVQKIVLDEPEKTVTVKLERASVHEDFVLYMSSEGAPLEKEVNAQSDGERVISYKISSVKYVCEGEG